MASPSPAKPSTSSIPPSSLQPLSSQTSVFQSTQTTLSSQSPTKPKSEKKAPSLRRPQAVVKIVVGEDYEQETFYVHKDLLCHHSPFFASAFNSTKYAESETQTMQLSDISEEDFGAFVQWLYTLRIELDASSRDANLIPLARLWTLAQRFRVSKLQNKLMDKLRPLSEAAEKDVLKGFLRYVHEGKEDKVELRRLAADRMAWATTQQGLGAWMDGGHLPAGMLIDIVMALKRDHVPGKPTVRHCFGDAKDYYVNSEIEVKEKIEDGEDTSEMV